MNGNSIPSVWKLIIAVLVCELTGIASSLLSGNRMDEWLDYLYKPTWNPPSYIFGPVWMGLYLLMGVSFWLIWKSNAQPSQKNNAMIIFGLQLCLSFFWSILFFRFHSPALALANVVLMLIFSFITMISFAPLSRLASWLLVPYILWVSFASVLNLTIWSMNMQRL
jgi:tryptophan-rich sensory protein